MEKTTKYTNTEELEVNTQILSNDELIQIIYKGETLPQDKRFLPIDKGGVFKYFFLEDIISIIKSSEKIFPVIYENNKIIGLAELEHDPKNPKNLWVKFISIDPLYQKKGYASLLLKKIFYFAKNNRYTLELSFYSEEGLTKLKNVVDRLSAETGVEITNSNLNI